MGLTVDLADYICSVSYDDFSREVIDKSKEAFLDWIGVTIAGAGEEVGEKIVAYVNGQAGNGDASIVGTSGRATLSDAALAMGTLSHALDFDDVYWPMIGHPSVTILPVVFVFGEAHGISGKKAIEAFVTGFEVEAVIGEATSEYHYHKGWHATSTIGPFGAAAAAGKILGLDTKQVRAAMGMAASHASGLRQNFGTMTKPLHAGNAARAGVVSALLAKVGFTSDIDILEAELGFANVFCGKGNHGVDRIRLGNKPVKSWALATPGRAVKKYPSCGATATAIDCVLQIVRDQKISPSEIERVDCLVNPKLKKILIKDAPKTGLEGKFSMPYCLSVAILDGDVGLNHFTDENVMRSDVQELLPKINLVDKDMDKLYEVAVIMKTKTDVFGERAAFAKGSPENPMSAYELESKFRMCVEKYVDDGKSQSIVDMVRTLDDVKDMNALIGLCCGK